MQGLCTSNFLKLNSSRTRDIAFSRKSNVFIYFKVCDFYIERADSIKELVIQLHTKLYFHENVDYPFSQSVRMLSLIRTITYSFSTLHSLLILYIIPVRPKLEYAPTVWNSITYTDPHKL